MTGMKTDEQAQDLLTLPPIAQKCLGTPVPLDHYYPRVDPQK